MPAFESPNDGDDNSSPTTQFKLKIGSQNDPYEREADAIADRVVSQSHTPSPESTPSPTQTSHPNHTSPPSLQHQSHLSLQPKTLPTNPALQRQGNSATSTDSNDISARLSSSRGGGTKLDTQTRSQMESSFGADFSTVRVHTDSSANQLSQDLGAKAFTHGSDIYFNKGQYNPGSRDGQHLLAHELTHTVQQGATVQRKPVSDDLEAKSAQSLSPNAHAIQAQAIATSPTAANSIRRFTPKSLQQQANQSLTSTISSTSNEVQRLPGFIMDELADYARHIPGYTLFTVIIGYNPLQGSRVERNATNLLEGLMGLVPFGTYLFDTLKERGILQKAFEWVEGELNRLDLSLGRIEQTIEDIWEDADLLKGFTYNLNIAKRHFGDLYDDVVSFAESLVSKIIELIKEVAIDAAEGLLGDQPVWDLFKKVIHYDPLRGEDVTAPTVEILEDFLILIGKEQELEQMKVRGTLQETADWLDQQIGTFMHLLNSVKSLFTAAWDAIKPENLPNLTENLTALATQTFQLVTEVGDFALTVALEVLALIKKALLGWLASFANDIPGFHLITVLIRRNPFTGDKVERNARNIIRGFISLLPGGDRQFLQLEETGTIGRAAAKIEGAMAELGINWEFIVGLFTGIWDSVSIEDLIDPVGTFQRITDQFGEPISRLFAFIKVVITTMVELILELMNFPSDIIGSIISNAMQAYDDIKRNVGRFFMNLLKAMKLGFSKFFDNIATHLLGGITDWLFGQLKDAGIQPPQELTLESVLDLVMQILGLSVDKLWEKLAERIGQDKVDKIRGAVDKLEGIWAFVRDVQERGIAAIWDYIQSQISNLWDMVLQQAQEWIMTKIIETMVTKLLSMLDPSGIMAVVNSSIALFKAIESAIDYLREMLEIINSFVTTVAEIARGALDNSAQFLENTLAQAMPVAIGFLANQVGLGKIGDKIREVVGSIQETIDKALDWLIDKAMAAFQSLLRALGIGGTSEEDETNADINAEPEKWWEAETNFNSADGGSHTLQFVGGKEQAKLEVHSNPFEIETLISVIDKNQDNPVLMRPLKEKKERQAVKSIKNSYGRIKKAANNDGSFILQDFENISLKLKELGLEIDNVPVGDRFILSGGIVGHHNCDGQNGQGHANQKHVYPEPSTWATGLSAADPGTGPSFFENASIANSLIQRLLNSKSATIKPKIENGDDQFEVRGLATENTGKKKRTSSVANVQGVIAVISPYKDGRKVREAKFCLVTAYPGT